METRSLLRKLGVLLVIAMHIGTQSAYALVNVTGTVNVDDAAATTIDTEGVNFGDAAGAVYWNIADNVGQSTGASVTVSADGNGLFQTSQAITFDGYVGSMGWALGQLNVYTTDNVTLTNNSHIDNVKFGADGTLLLAQLNKTLTAENVDVVTTNTGTLDLAYGGLLGTVGDSTHYLKLVRVHDRTLKIGSMGDSYVENIELGMNASTVSNLYIYNNLFADIKMYTAAGYSSIHLFDNSSLTGNVVVDAAASDSQLYFVGNTTINGQVGSPTKGVNEMWVYHGVSTVNINGDAYANTLIMQDIGDVVFDGNYTGDVNFRDGQGTVLMKSGHTLTGTVTTTVNGKGSIQLDTDANIIGQIGTETLSLRDVYFNPVSGEGGISDINYDIYSQIIEAETNRRVNINSNIIFGANGGTSFRFSGTGNVLNVATNTLTVQGDMLLNGTETLEFGIADDSTYGSIVVTGTADIPSTVALDIMTSGNYISDGAIFTLVDSAAGAGVVGGNSITDDNNFVTFAVSQLNNQDLIITATRTDTSYVPYADTSNTTEVAKVLDTVAGQSSDMDTVLSVIDTLDTSDGSLDHAFEQMAADVSAGVKDTVVVAHNDSLKTISNRVNSLRKAGVASGDVLEDAELWGQAFGAYQEQDTRHGIKGYDANVWGFTLGMDKNISNSVLAGFAAGYSKSVVDFAKESTGDSDIESYQFSVYGTYQNEDAPWYLNSMASFAWNEYDGSRTVNFGSIDRTANSDYAGQQYSLSFGGGYSFDFDDLKVTPMANVQYMYLEMDGYTETGADSLNLKVDGRDYEFLDLEIGTEFEYPIFLNNSDVSIVPSLHAKYAYEFLGEKEVVSSQFTGGGAAFRSEGVKPAKASYRYGASVEINFSDNLSLDLRYNGQTKEDYTDHNGSATVRIKF